MKLQFDAKQSCQIDAVSAVVDLFDGQPRNDLEVDEHLEPHGFGASAPASLSFSFEMETPVWPGALRQRSRHS